MFALVTCHIFPPLNLIRKKMNSWHLTSRLTARSFSESTASRVRSGRCPRQCATLLHGQMHLQEKNACFAIWPHVGTKFFNLSHRFLSMDGWPGDAIFFLWGQPLKIIHKNSAKKRSSPLDFIFDTCASALQVTFFWLVKLNICGCTKDNCIFSKKTCVLQFGRALTQNSWIRPIMSYQWMIGLVMRLFSCGPTFEDHPQVFSQKRSSPLDFIFDPCALASWSHFFGWWSWTYVFDTPYLFPRMLYEAFYRENWL